MSPLAAARREYAPKLPPAFHQLKQVILKPMTVVSVHRELAERLARTAQQPPLQMIMGTRAKPPVEQRVGVVLSGGQAPGGHNVICGLYDALKALHPDSVLYGFCNGPSGILQNKSLKLTKELLASYRNQGGFDLLGSGRTKIETPQQFQAAEQTIRALELDGLVVIGGDDSNTNAALLADYFLERQCRCAVVGVPKTIDGDLKSAEVELSFGFDTACKTYAETIGNIARDAVSAKKYYYFIKLMGRSASHIALECALQTQPNLVWISEEVAQRKASLAQLVAEACDMICRRAEQGKQYGIILIPEGIIEFIPEFQQLIQELNALLAEEQVANIQSRLTPPSAHCLASIPPTIQQQLLMDRDPHGNVQVSKIETERLFIGMVEEELKRRKQAGCYQGSFSAQPHFCGYEGRSCLPSNFDSDYCYTLGHVAALLVDAQATGYIAYVQQLAEPATQWRAGGYPIVAMMHLEERGGKKKPVIQKALVDLKGAAFGALVADRGQWAVGDDYRYPGPIQFWGSEAICEARPRILTER